MTSDEMTFLDHCVAASDALKRAAGDAELSHSTKRIITDLRQAGELLLQAAFAVVEAGTENDASAQETYGWALIKVSEVATAMPGDGLPLLARLAAAAEKAQDRAAG